MLYLLPLPLYDILTIIGLNDYRRLTFGNFKISYSGWPIVTFSNLSCTLKDCTNLMKFFYLTIQQGQYYLTTTIPIQKNTAYIL